MNPVKLAIIGFVAAASLAVWMCIGGDRQPSFAYQWKEGQRLRYALSWTAEQTTRLPPAQAKGTGGALGGATEMALDLVLDTVSVQPGRAQLVARFDDLRTHRMQLLGREVLASEKEAHVALLADEALVDVASDGSIEKIAFRNGSNDVFRALMAWVLTHTEVVVSPGDVRSRWATEEPDVFGTGPVEYERHGLAVERTRPRYASLTLLPNATAGDAAAARASGGSKVTLDARGFVGSIESDERLQLDGEGGQRRLEAAAKLSLKLREVTAVGAGAPVALSSFQVSVAPGEVVPTESAEVNALEQRIDGMTAEMLLGDLERQGDGGLMPEHTRWMWRATGLLTRDPALAEKLVALVENGKVIGRGRALIADVLASVGHGPAQDALVRLVNSAAVRNSPDRAALVQRFAFVDAPTTKSADTLLALYADGKRAQAEDLRLTSAFALGSAAGHMAKAGDSAAAQRYAGRLVDELAASKTSEDKAALLRALGNAGLESNTEVAKRYAEDADSDVREAATRALRKVETKAATDTLVGALVDNSGAVQAGALDGLTRRKLDDATLSQVAEAARANGFAKRLDGAILNLCQRYPSSPAAAEMVRTVLARPDADPSLRARARMMLGHAG